MYLKIVSVIIELAVAAETEPQIHLKMMSVSFQAPYIRRQNRILPSSCRRVATGGAFPARSWQWHVGLGYCHEEAGGIDLPITSRSITSVGSYS